MKWISVKNEFPKGDSLRNSYTLVLSSSDIPPIQLRYFSSLLEKWIGVENVTHWMPVPNPPGDDE